MSEWIEFDKASHRALILAAYQSGKMSGAKAWDEFSSRSLWGCKEEAFFNYVNGLHAFEAARDVNRSPEFVRRGVKRLTMFLYTRELIKLETAQWIIALFGVGVE